MFQDVADEIGRRVLNDGHHPQIDPLEPDTGFVWPLEDETIPEGWSEEQPSADIPALPDAVRIGAEAGKGACKWLDGYTLFSRRWSPRAYVDFHEAVGLWLLSMIAARRVMVNVGKPTYTNIYLSLAARTSLFAKSTTVGIGNQTLYDAGLSYLLAPDTATPQAFVNNLTARIGADYDNLSPEQKEIARFRAAMAGQRGWFYEEFGQHLSAMMREGGFMADFRGLLRRFDDCPEKYESSTIGRGSDLVERPYLALLACMTPDDLRPFAKRGSSLWGDGFLARFALITPPDETCEYNRERFPQGPRIIPADIIAPLVSWHRRLGIPDVSVRDTYDQDGKATGLKQVDCIPIPPRALDVSPEVFEAFYAYHDGLLDILVRSDNHDLDGNYARFAEKALRIAALLGSLENSVQVSIKHWARAQEITERWRGGLHELYRQINEPGPSKERENEEKALRVIEKHGDSTAAEVSRFVRNLSSGEASRLLDSMVDGGVLQANKTQRGTKRYGFPKEETPVTINKDGSIYV